jgi:hypothetical protein
MAPFDAINEQPGIKLESQNDSQPVMAIGHLKRLVTEN